MSQTSNGKGHEEFRTAVTMTVVWVAGLTLVTIFGALLAGIWLDKILNSKPILTIVFILISIPMTLFLTFRVVKSVTARFQPVSTKKDTKEDAYRAEDNRN
jgi:F0F1-type ATP synthase assembly protein I